MQASDVLSLASRLGWPEVSSARFKYAQGEPSWRVAVASATDELLRDMSETLQQRDRELDEQAAERRETELAEEEGLEDIAAERARLDRESPAGVARRTLEVLQKIEAHLASR